MTPAELDAVEISEILPLIKHVTTTYPEAKRWVEDDLNCEGIYAGLGSTLNYAAHNNVDIPDRELEIITDYLTAVYTGSSDWARSMLNHELGYIAKIKQNRIRGGH